MAIVCCITFPLYCHYRQLHTPPTPPTPCNTPYVRTRGGSPARAQPTGLGCLLRAGKTMQALVQRPPFKPLPITPPQGCMAGARTTRRLSSPPSWLKRSWSWSSWRCLRSRWTISQLLVQGNPLSLLDHQSRTSPHGWRNSPSWPGKAPELFAYQASIVRAERNFEGQRWVTYDKCYRWEALASKSLDWSVPNLRLYNEAFTGHARTIPRCSFCLQEDHTLHACPRNPSWPWFGVYHETEGHAQCPPGPRMQSTECCCQYNEGKCRQRANTCRYAHKCQACGGPHPHPQCPCSGQESYLRPRSPRSNQNQMGPPGHPPMRPFPGRHY